VRSLFGSFDVAEDRINKHRAASCSAAKSYAFFSLQIFPPNKQQSCGTDATNLSQNLLLTL